MMTQQTRLSDLIAIDAFEELSIKASADEFGSIDDFQYLALDDTAAPIAPTTQVSTAWLSGDRSISRTYASEPTAVGRDRAFSLTIDGLLAGKESQLGPSIQEVALAALNAFILKTFIECCEQQQLPLEQVEVTSSGNPDLHRFLGSHRSVISGDEPINWTLMVKGNATLEEFQEVFETAFGISPNDWNLVVLI